MSNSDFNPYADTSRTAEPPMQPQGDHRIVNQVPIVGALLIVVGVLELLMSAMLLIGAVFLPMAIAQAQKQNAGNQIDTTFMNVMLGYYIGIGGITFIFAILRIIAGSLAFFLKGRGLLFVSLIGGLVSIGTFYCAIFSIGIGVYGLVVLLHPSVKLAFDMRQSGMSAEEVRNRLLRS